MWEIIRGGEDMSISIKEFRERLRENKTRCFCGRRLLIGRDGIPYCPACNAIQLLDLGGKEPKHCVGVVRLLNGKQEFVY